MGCFVPSLSFPFLRVALDGGFNTAPPPFFASPSYTDMRLLNIDGFIAFKGFFSIIFDLLFMTQHYILYTDRTDIYANLNGDSANDGLKSEKQKLIYEDEEEDA